MQSEISYDTPVGKGAIPLMILESVFRSLLLNPGIKTLWGHNPMKKIKKEGSGKMFNTTLIALQGFHPRRFVLTYYLNGTTSLSRFSAGTVKGDRYGPLRHRTSALYFIA